MLALILKILLAIILVTEQAADTIKLPDIALPQTSLTDTEIVFNSPAYYTRNLRPVQNPKYTLFFRFSMTESQFFMKDLEYKILCGSEKTRATPYFSDAEVKKLIDFDGKCVELLQNPYVDVYYPSKETLKLKPVPLNQEVNGFQVYSQNTAPPIELLTTCCNEADCPSKCLDLSRVDQDCDLEVYTIGASIVYDDGPAAAVARIFTGQDTFKMDGAFLKFLYRIKCKHCFIKSCITNCTNGQFANDFSTYSQVPLEYVMA